MSTPRPSAIYVRENPCNSSHMTHLLWELSTPLGGWDRVVTSAADLTRYGAAPETYVFPADDKGHAITRTIELDGSYRGDLDHARALLNAGYDVIYDKGTR